MNNLLTMISNKIITKEFLMELVYLWVEKYKNIEKQGFDFSPRFMCEYDEDTKKLGKVVDKEKTGEFYPKNFFGENINVTAIVGGNGSGKSSLLNSIGNKGTFFNKNNEVCNLEKEKDYKIIHTNYDLLKINKPSYPNNNRIGLEYKNPYIRGKNSQTNINVLTFFKYMVNNILKHCYSFKSEIFFFNPMKIMFFDTFHPTKDNCKKLAKEVKDKNFSKEKLLTFLYIELFEDENPKIHEIESDIMSIEKEILEKFKVKNIENIYALLERIEESTILIEEFKDIYNVYKESLLELRNIGYLKIDFTDKEGREYFDLSQGERKLFTEMLMIFDEIKQSKNNNFLLLLDEPDLTLHPDWQKRYISEMIKLLSNFSEKKFHLIVTTHSPFILSDLPKENIIFLEKGKQVYPFDDGKQTFGANIHTLLSHGFFMKDGLMGEFAKDKIKSIINYHEKIKELTKNENKKQRDEEKEIYEKEHKTKFRQIQSIIGDDYLKQVIKNHVVEIEKILYDEYLIDKEIKKLEDEIDRLKRLKK
ncbi:MAG: AAA family ATPase [Campylobacterales bacterium]|nr:AAA family ATPase [Campylobacterales bacterium]